MVIGLNININQDAVLKSIDRVTSQIYKLLPLREEGGDWTASLENLIVEVGGMASLLSDHTDLFPLLCKLKGILSLTDENDFFRYRSCIFECLGLMNKIKKCLD